MELLFNHFLEKTSGEDRRWIDQRPEALPYVAEGRSLTQLNLNIGLNSSESQRNEPVLKAKDPARSDKKRSFFSKSRLGWIKINGPNKGNEGERIAQEKK